MRPNLAKPKPLKTTEVHNDSEDERSAVLETQAEARGVPHAAGSNDQDLDYASDVSHTPKVRKTQAKKAEAMEGPSHKDGLVKTAARKIKATANANYRRLNIKGKAGTGAKGKFGRRR